MTVLGELDVVDNRSVTLVSHTRRSYATEYVATARLLIREVSEGYN